MAETRKPKKPSKQKHQHQSHKTHSHRWGAIRVLFSHHHHRHGSKSCGKIGCSVSLCNLKESSKVTHRAEVSPPDASKKVGVPVGGSGDVSATASGRSVKSAQLSEINRPVSSSLSSSLSASSITATSSSSSSSSFSSLGGSFRGMQLRRLSGCYECHSVVNPSNGVSREPSLRSIICTCPECGEIFVKAENLELHQAVRHAVSELGREDTSRNVVEIIFQSSWLKKHSPPCKIDRILKINNTQRTVARFEDYRDTIKSKATRYPKRHPRCVADGNELLRFHCATFSCSIGHDGSTSLCHSAPRCGVCSIIKDGFRVDGTGRVRTMATSGRAHDVAAAEGGEDRETERRAMLVCRVIAGRMRKGEGAAAAVAAGEEWDSVTGAAGVYSNLDELFVFNPRAILPCFLVVYRVG